jgi:hypothetical protein
MPQAHKVLGQSNPSAATLATLYTVPSATQSVASTLAICNQAASAGSFRIAVRPAGASVAAQHYIAYDAPIAGNDTVFLTLGVSLATTDVVSVYASSASQSFSLFGVEIT